MNVSPKPVRGAVALDDLIALNEEIAALSRSGLPLERGLIGVGGDLPGRLGAIARELGQRMEGGESLVQALEANRSTIPPTYRAVVQAGVRSGRLAEALEGLAGFARSYSDLRRSIGLALLYPTIVLLLGYGLFVLFVVELIPRIAESFESLHMSVGPWLSGVSRMGRWAPVWGPILPCLVALGVIAWWRSGRASAFRPGKVGLALRWVPGIGPILDSAIAGQFADWLALLIEHDVPWSEAVTLSADATGDDRLIKAARALAEASDRGETVPSSLRDNASLPPLLGWLMSDGRGQASLVTALKHAAETYRRRALRRAASLRVLLPTVLLIAIGAVTTLLYTLTLYAPWTSLLRAMTRVH